MLRKSGLLALTLGVLAAPVAAEEHYVLMLGNGYFPDYTYPVIGDTIRFVNNTDIAMSATATDDSWSTGVMQPGDVFILEVTEGIKQTFKDTVTPGNQAIGVIDYLNPAPLDLAENEEQNHTN